MALAIWCSVSIFVAWVPDGIEIGWVRLLDLNVGADRVVVVLNCLHLLLLQMWREIILLLVIKIVNSSNLLISIFGILFCLFAVILCYYQGLVNITNRSRWCKSILPKMSNTWRHNRLHRFRLLRIPNILHDIQALLHGSRVIAISNLILILQQHLLLVKCILIVLNIATNSIVGIDILQFRRTVLFHACCSGNVL